MSSDRVFSHALGNICTAVPPTLPELTMDYLFQHTKHVLYYAL
jgi:hypothetical protein